MVTLYGMLLVSAAILGYGLVSGRAQRSPITPPMVFVGLGCLVSQHGLGLLELHLEGELLRLLLELTLVMILFSDAARIDLRRLRSEHDLPLRMLVVGLPLTLLAGTLAGLALLPALGLLPAALLAAVLAPTDAALGQAVVSSPRVPVRIRQTLNVESGLNDGIALPVVLMLVALVGARGGGEGASYWLRFAALQVTLGPLVGVAVGYLGGRLVDRAMERRLMTPTYRDLAAVGLALLAFSVAELLGGNGFIAAFCAGLALGNTAREICKLEEFAEAEGQLLTLLVFMAFGGLLVPDALAAIDLPTAIYALLSLTLVRMVPVAISLLGKRLAWETVLFLGWFGPRGLASILFALVVVEGAEGMADSHLAIVSLVVLGSVVAHGLTADPAARWYAQRVAAKPEEQAPVSEMPLRVRSPEA